MKTCIICKETKPKSNFHNVGVARGGRVGYCGSCKCVAGRIRSTLDGMKSRCFSLNNPSYKYYGAKGIEVCEEWCSGPSSFIAWAIVNGWKDGLTIDRIDSKRGYEPNNCQWLTFIENTRKGGGERALTREEILTIREEMAAGGDKEELAKRFGRGAGTIVSISRRHSYVEPWEKKDIVDPLWASKDRMKYLEEKFLDPLRDGS